MERNNFGKECLSMPSYPSKKTLLQGYFSFYYCTVCGSAAGDSLSRTYTESSTLARSKEEQEPVIGILASQQESMDD